MNMQGLFVTGTDTGVGKTVATSLIARQLCRSGHRTGCYKPVCSGSELMADGSKRWADIDALSAAIGDAHPHDRICPQTFDAPLAPPSAARLEGRDVDRAVMRQGAAWWSAHADVLLVEGVGGLLCPIATDETVADLAVDLGFPLLIVSPLILGTINHTLMTIDVARNRGLDVAGIVFNDVGGEGESVRESTLAEISSRTSVPLRGTIAYNRMDGIRPLGGTDTIDWMNVVRPSGTANFLGGCQSGPS